MRKKTLHHSDEKFLEYYFDREAADAGFVEHLLSCSLCSGHYRELERSLDSIKSAFQEEQEIHWGAQRQRIIARLEEPGKTAFVVPWRKLAPVAAAILITIVLIFSFNPWKDEPTLDAYYLNLSKNDDLLIDEMRNLIDRPLLKNMDSINFWMSLAEQEEQSGSLSPPLRRVNHAKT